MNENKHNYSSIDASHGSLVEHGIKYEEFCSGHNIKDFFLMLFSYSRLMSPEVFNDVELRRAEISQRSGKKKQGY